VGTAGDARTHPRRAAGLEIQVVDDGFTIYQADRDRLHYLNHTAVLVLELCDGTQAPEDIAGLLAQAYGLAAPPEQDVRVLVARLADEGLVE
jgi:hypothetical protein